MAQRERMVNIQTFQYELLKNKIYYSCVGIFLRVRAILQLSLPIDHPVVVVYYGEHGRKHCLHIHVYMDCGYCRSPGPRLAYRSPL